MPNLFTITNFALLVLVIIIIYSLNPTNSKANVGSKDSSKTHGSTLLVLVKTIN
ncbi:hypothetical protein HanPSC8_Chr01g0039291 [Helianthus annuus]|nr:hypothetical protein HanPSC8_Chr01g0039291 [Helianthus annuus]